METDQAIWVLLHSETTIGAKTDQVYYDERMHVLYDQTLILTFSHLTVCLMMVRPGLADTHRIL